MTEIKAGDIVRSKLGGPKMIVVGIEPSYWFGPSGGVRPEGDQCTCEWFNERNELQRSDFWSSTLESTCQ